MKWKRMFFASCLAAGLLSVPSPTYAVSREVRSVIVVSAYGALAGTALGLLAYPATQEVRAIPMGTSVGLYLGIILGIYLVNHRDDPGNPLAWDFQVNDDLVKLDYRILRF